MIFSPKVWWLANHLLPNEASPRMLLLRLDTRPASLNHLSRWALSWALASWARRSSWYSSYLFFFTRADLRLPPAGMSTRAPNKCSLQSYLTSFFDASTEPFATKSSMRWQPPRVTSTQACSQPLVPRCYPSQANILDHSNLTTNYNLNYAYVSGGLTLALIHVGGFTKISTLSNGGPTHIYI